MAGDLAALIAQLAQLRLEHEEANQHEFERLQKLIESNTRAIEALTQNQVD